MGAGIAQKAKAWRDIDLHGVRLDESSADGKPRSWIMIAPIGTFQHERYGELHFTRAKLAEMKQNFDERVRHIDIALDVDHDQGKAPGWFEKLELRHDGLYGLVRWTPYGVELLNEELYRYFSPEFGDWPDPETGQEYHNVLMGGGLTNRPFLKTMGDVHLSEAERAARDVRLLHDAVAEAVRLAEISNRSWGSVNKSKLPRSCFLIQGDPDDKETWKLPVYEGTGPMDAGGHYTKRGPLNINGVRAALAAIGGARQDGPMAGVPASVKARLERWIQQYGASGKSGDGGSGSKAASDRVGRTSKDGGDQVGKKLKDQRSGTADELDELEDDEASYQFADDMGGDNEEYDEDTSGDEPEEDKNDGDEDEDDQDTAAVNPKSNTHAALVTKGHMHGKYAEHSHNNDADHSDAELCEPSKMSDRRSGSRTSRHGREDRSDVKQLREELATMRYKLYEKEVGETLEGWKNQTFQFREGIRKDKDGKPQPVMKSGRVALSRAFADKYKSFMLTEAIRLTEAQRTRLNELVEAALSSAIVDLSMRGSSYDQESRRTVAARDRKPGGPAESDKLQEMAERMALSEEGKPFAALDYPTKMDIYARASREIDYK